MILYYDDTCGFCSRSISFLQKRNAPLTYIGLSKANLPKRLTHIDSLILQKNGFYYVYADAAIRSIASIGSVYKLIVLFFIVPRFIRDWAYKLIAKRRKCVISPRNAN